MQIQVFFEINEISDAWQRCLRNLTIYKVALKTLDYGG